MCWTCAKITRCEFHGGMILEQGWCLQPMVTLLFNQNDCFDIQDNNKENCWCEKSSSLEAGPNLYNALNRSI